jgi:hypothetical protein
LRGIVDYSLFYSRFGDNLSDSVEELIIHRTSSQHKASNSRFNEVHIFQIAMMYSSLSEMVKRSAILLGTYYSVLL